MLLRDEIQTALNEVETLCLASADDYASSAGKAEDPTLARQFEGVAQQRRALAAALAPHIRALGDLPQVPDPDREAVEHVLVGIQAFLSGDRTASLRAHHLRTDAQLQQALASALQQRLPNETHSLLERMLQQVELTRHWLEGARASPPPDS
jgi:uncharacterized protein (TIGR02284 family)